MDRHDLFQTDLGSFKQGWLEAELNEHTVNSPILKELKNALNLPEDSKPKFTLSGYKEVGKVPNNIYPRYFSVKYTFELNDISESGLLEGFIEPKKTVDGATGKEMDMVNCFSFSFSGIKDIVQK